VIATGWDVRFNVLLEQRRLERMLGEVVVALRNDVAKEI
jgi:hypothetical protein